LHNYNCTITITQLQLHNYNYTITITQLQLHNYNTTITIAQLHSGESVNSLEKTFSEF